MFEALVLLLRGQPLATLGDNTALVAAWLLALTLPPLAPWWIAGIGSAAAMLLGKHVFGGIGANPFNPAMVGYALLLVSFPREMTAWLQPALFDASVSASVIGPGFDAITGATPLDRLREVGGDGAQLGSDSPPWQGWFGSYAWEWVNAGFLLGGLALLYLRVISWHIPVAMLTGLGSCYLVSWLIPGGSTLSPAFGLFSGAAMLGAFFIATDPVSAAASRNGRLFYAAGIGLLTYLIRQFGGYPEGIAFAVLLMNCAAPAIDHYGNRWQRAHDNRRSK